MKETISSSIKTELARQSRLHLLPIMRDICFARAHFADSRLYINEYIKVMLLAWHLTDPQDGGAIVGDFIQRSCTQGLCNDHPDDVNETKSRR